MSDAAVGGWTVSIDIVLFTLRARRLHVLLVTPADPVFRGRWALPGGRVRPGEEPTAAAHRELAEETGVRVPWLEQLASYGAPGRDPRGPVLTVAHVAIVADLPLPVAGTDAARARWWPVGELPPLGLDHATILTDGLGRARGKLEWTTVAATFLAEPFTLSELHAVYAAVWDSRPHLPNFRRKVLAVPDWLVPTGGQRAPGPGGGPPAQLYRRGGAVRIHPPLERPAADEWVDAATGVPLDSGHPARAS